MVYEEPYAALVHGRFAEDGPALRRSLLGMVRRDRNHPSVMMWGLLNETPDGPVFRHAVDFLPALRALDDSRMVMLNSGPLGTTASAGIAGIEAWHHADRADPCVTYNATEPRRQGLGITWAPGQLAFHPGREGRVRRGPLDRARRRHGRGRGRLHQHRRAGHHRRPRPPQRPGAVRRFHQPPGRAARSRSSQAPCGSQPATRSTASAASATTTTAADTTALAVTVKSAAGKTYDAAADFSGQATIPTASGATGNAARSRPAGRHLRSLSRGNAGPSRRQPRRNPGSAVWEDMLGDRHPYPARAPHGRHHPDAADVGRRRQAAVPLRIRHRQRGGPVARRPALRTARQATDADDAQFYRAKLDRFLADWRAMEMAEASPGPRTSSPRASADGRPSGCSA